MSLGSYPQEARPDAFASALRDAINSRGVTLSWLQSRIQARGNRVSLSTLSYWRSGARQPEGAQSLAALADIEEALNLKRGTLTRLLIASRRTGPVGSALFPTMDVSLEQGVMDAYAALGAPYPSPSRELTTHSVTDVDANGNVARCNTRTVVQSTSGTLTGIPFMTMTPGMSTPPPRFSAVAGGKVGAHYSARSGELHGALFALDRPLASPDTTIVEWSIDYPPDFPPMKDSGHAVARKGRELLTWVRFHPDAVPDWCDEVVKTPKGVTVTPLCLEGVTSIHRVRRSFGPGAVEISWGYGPRE